MMAETTDKDIKKFVLQLIKYSELNGDYVEKWVNAFVI